MHQLYFVFPRSENTFMRVVSSCTLALTLQSSLFDPFVDLVHVVSSFCLELILWLNGFS